jgi:hypothetical protein
MMSARRLLPASANVAALLVALTTRHAAAQAIRELPPAATFEYRTPTQKTYLRGVLELQGFYAFGLFWYMSDVVHWDPHYSWGVFQEKLTNGKLAQDFNGFGTNFRGHATGGTGYYLAARSNRLGVGESFGIAVLGAVAWEYFGEVSEQVSLNDLIYTPLSGTAIAESFTQLAGYFDRAARTPLNRALGTLFGPLKTLNDTLDGLELSRSSAGQPAREWHDFPLQVGFASVAEAGSLPGAARASEVRLRLSERLARLPGYDGAAQRDYWFDDAQLSGIALAAAFAPHGLSDFVFEPHAVMAGHYWRSARGSGASLRGSGYATGLRVGLTYQLHDYRRQDPRQADFAAFIEPLGWFLESRAALGRARLRVTLDAGAEYGGMHPIALQAFRAAPGQLPREVAIFSYYFALGARARSQLELRLQRLSFDVGMTAWGFGSVDEHVEVPISDGFTRFGAGLGYGVDANTTLHGYAERTQRFGHMGDVHADARELTLGVEGVARF